MQKSFLEAFCKDVWAMYWCFFTQGVPVGLKPFFLALCKDPLQTSLPRPLHLEQSWEFDTKGLQGAGRFEFWILILLVWWNTHGSWCMVVLRGKSSLLEVFGSPKKGLHKFCSVSEGMYRKCDWMWINQFWNSVNQILKHLFGIRGGHFIACLVLGGRNSNKPIFKSLNARGGGMLKFWSD